MGGHEPMFSDQEKRRIVAALNKRGADTPCPRCHRNEFSVVDGYLILRPQLELDTSILGGPSVVAVMVVCANCGHISLHALDQLDALSRTGKAQLDRRQKAGRGTSL
jgi:hypothetical protein